MACWRGVCRFLRCQAGPSQEKDGSPRPPHHSRSLPSIHEHAAPEATVFHEELLAVKKNIDASADFWTVHCLRDLGTRRLLRRGVSTVFDHYSFSQDMLGQGSFSIVRTGLNSSTGTSHAVKMINKDIKDAPDFKVEIELLTALDHENIIRLIETFEDTGTYYLVMDLCTGGELFDRIVEIGEITEPQAALLMRQVAGTITYMHGEGVVHRDLKPENFVFETRGPLEATPLKLIDFGLSRRFEPGEVLTTSVGTVLYVAPEVLKQSYGPMCDLWSFGAIVYNILCGSTPFDGATAKQVVKNIRKGTFGFEAAVWDSVTDEAKDMIRRLLTKDPAARLSGRQVLEHPWIERLAAGSCGEPLDSEVINRLQDLGVQNRKAKSIQRQLMAEQLGLELP